MKVVGGSKCCSMIRNQSLWMKAPLRKRELTYVAMGDAEQCVGWRNVFKSKGRRFFEGINDLNIRHVGRPKGEGLILVNVLGEKLVDLGKTVLVF